MKLNLKEFNEMKISFKEDINSVSYFKANFNQILEKMSDNHRPMIHEESIDSKLEVNDIPNEQQNLPYVSLNN